MYVKDHPDWFAGRVWYTYIILMHTLYTVRVGWVRGTCREKGEDDTTVYVVPERCRCVAYLYVVIKTSVKQTWYATGWPHREIPKERCPKIFIFFFFLFENSLIVGMIKHIQFLISSLNRLRKITCEIFNPITKL